MSSTILPVLEIDFSISMTVASPVLSLPNHGLSERLFFWNLDYIVEGEYVKIFPWKSVEAQKAEDGAEGVTVRWLLTKDQGADNFYMRLFEMEPGGHTPLHDHPWEHEVLILKGSGVVSASGEETEFHEGDVLFLPSGERHQFRNAGKDVVRFLCLIPGT